MDLKSTKKIKKLIKEIHNKNSKIIALTSKRFQFLEKYKTIINFIMNLGINLSDPPNN